jgi:RHS repeat-associated protein
LANLLHATPVSRLNFTNKYIYDLAGNRLWKTNIAGAVTTTTGYSYNANDQLVTETNVAGSFTNKYDANGSVTNRSSDNETNLYAYNLEGRLATATIRRTEGGNPIVQTNKYFYNQSGIRVREEMTGSENATNIFPNDPQNLTGFSQVLEELPAVGTTPTASYIIGSQLISQKKSGINSYFMTDGHESTRILTDTNSTISDLYSYDAYGMALDFTFGTLNPPRTAILYSGERFDSDLQQYYLRARYYNPQVGLFGVQDQVDGTPNDPLSLHKYAYTQNNPVIGRDPSGNDLISLSLGMSIGAALDVEYNGVVLGAGYIASKKVTEAGTASESLWEIAGNNASPGVDTATIIVHGVSGHPYGWSQDFQNALTASRNQQNQSDPLNHDFYEFDWGGFSIDDNWFLIPIKSVHEMALVHLQMEEFLVWMNGYANINIISHSWGTTLTYDLQQTSGIETHNWVTMGLVLKEATPKPFGVKGNWINFSSPDDPAYHAALYPPFPDNIVSLNSLGPNVHSDPNVDIPHVFPMGKSGIDEHSAYWDDPQVLSRLRNYLQ